MEEKVDFHHHHHIHIQGEEDRNLNHPQILQ